ncbi:major tail protein [Tepidanaerobacter syntrophicus]|uniref:major tail protein n=1 Tax=Tepidanaerobacter syntrophicus TaxID=224999 RepID=UPI001BD25E51|nr:major tail protein [Tepidanaerobacter syntrophicus]
MAKNKIIYGLKNVHIAFRNDVGGTPAWGDPIAIPGAVNFAPSPEGEESTFYADDGPYFKISTNNGYTANLEMALIPDDVLAEMMGWTIDDNGMVVEDADAQPKEFALMGQVSGDAKNRRFVYYRCTANRSEPEHATKGETLEPTTTTLSITILPIEVGGKNIVKGVIEPKDDGTNLAVYNAFFDEVIIPDATAPTVDKTVLASTIALANTLVEDEAEYTVDSWTVFENALTAATTVNANASATQKQVNDADAALKAAILSLVPEA